MLLMIESKEQIASRWTSLFCTGHVAADTVLSVAELNLGPCSSAAVSLL